MYRISPNYPWSESEPWVFTPLEIYDPMMDPREIYQGPTTFDLPWVPPTTTFDLADALLPVRFDAS